MKLLALVLAASIVTGCSPVQSDEPVVPAEEEVLPVEPDGSIGDGVSRPMLMPMVYDEFSQAIEAGAGCAFVAQGNTDPLFVATAPDSDKIAGKGAIKINDTIVVLTHNGVGLAQVEAGGVFASEAVEVTIAHSGGEPSSEKEGTYFWPATLKISQDEVGSNMYEGTYECGA